MRILKEDRKEIGEHLLESGFKPYREHAILYRSCIKSKIRNYKILSI